jgi:hypothetical protein
MAGPNAAGAPDFDDPSGWKIEAIQDGTVSYVRFPAMDDQLPAGTSWVRTDESKPGIKQGTDFDFQQLANNDPRTMLDFLRATSADIETVGREKLRGEGTTHYRATIEPLEYAKLAPLEKREELQSVVQQMGAQSGLTTIPVEVWLDADGLVRKLSFEFSAAQPGGSEQSDASITFELWDYGEDVAIELPAASEVVDASAVRS